jgi:D-sedoheptulose 7-phosphate isomerase
MLEWWKKYHLRLEEALAQLEVTSLDHAVMPSEKAFEMLCQWSHEVHEARGTIHFAGNGASACMASHFAVDWTKNAGIKAMAYNDLAFLTAIGNDLGYDQIFARPVLWYAERGDLLVTISSSGNSPNVIKAIGAAREKGIRVVTLSGMKANNTSRASGDLNFYIPAPTYGIVECAHQVLLHAWLDRYMEPPQ